MLTINELNRINDYLSYLACGIKDNGLSKEQYKEVLNLSTKCFSEANKIEDKLKEQKGR